MRAAEPDMHSGTGGRAAWKRQSPDARAFLTKEAMMKLRPLILYTALLGALPLAATTMATPAAQAAHGDVATRVKALNALLAEQWQHTLENSPEFATILGDLRYNDRWSDFSLAHTAAERKVTEDFLR